MSGVNLYTAPERVAELHAVRDRHTGDESATQCSRLLDALETLGHVTTFEASRFLDLYAPPRSEDAACSRRPSHPNDLAPSSDRIGSFAPRRRLLTGQGGARVNANSRFPSRKDETLGVMAEGFMDNRTSHVGDSAAEPRLDQAPRSYGKRLADVTTRLAAAGFSLYPLHDETLLVTRWNMTRTLPSIEAAERFLHMVGGVQA